MADTVRESLVKALQNIVACITNDEGELVFNNVYRGNLDADKSIAFPAVGLEEGEEETIDLMFPKIDKRLRIIIHFKFTKNVDVDLSSDFNYYLGQLQNVVFNDLSIGGFGFNIQEIGNVTEMENRFDKRPGGALIVEVSYRHVNGDPFTKV